MGRDVGHQPFVEALEDPAPGLAFGAQAGGPAVLGAQGPRFVRLFEPEQRSAQLARAAPLRCADDGGAFQAQTGVGLRADGDIFGGFAGPFVHQSIALEAAGEQEEEVADGRDEAVVLGEVAVDGRPQDALVRDAQEDVLDVAGVQAEAGVALADLDEFQRGADAAQYGFDGGVVGRPLVAGVGGLEHPFQEGLQRAGGGFECEVRVARVAAVQEFAGEGVQVFVELGGGDAFGDVADQGEGFAVILVGGPQDAAHAGPKGARPIGGAVDDLLAILVGHAGQKLFGGFGRGEEFAGGEVEQEAEFVFGEVAGEPAGGVLGAFGFADGGDPEAIVLQAVAGFVPGVVDEDAEVAFSDLEAFVAEGADVVDAHGSAPGCVAPVDGVGTGVGVAIAEAGQVGEAEFALEDGVEGGEAAGGVVDLAAGAFQDLTEVRAFEDDADDGGAGTGAVAGA